MGKLDTGQKSTAAGDVHLGTRRPNRVAFRRVLYMQPSPGFLAELCNPGLWNDFVVEMVNGPVLSENSNLCVCVAAIINRRGFVYSAPVIVAEYCESVVSVSVCVSNLRQFLCRLPMAEGSSVAGW